ncbi:MAG: transglycosylase SLT domain-containing protein [Candidatus Peregrinibacteria bacterium]
MKNLFHTPLKNIFSSSYSHYERRRCFFEGGGEWQNSNPIERKKENSNALPESLNEWEKNIKPGLNNVDIPNIGKVSIYASQFATNKNSWVARVENGKSEPYKPYTEFLKNVSQIKAPNTSLNTSLGKIPENRSISDEEIRNITTKPLVERQRIIKNATADQFYSIPGNDDLNKPLLKTLLYDGQRGPLSRAQDFSQYTSLIEAQEKAYDLPNGILIKVIRQESKGDPLAFSGSLGIAQLNKYITLGAGENYWGRINPFNPYEAIPRAAQLLRYLFNKFGDRNVLKVLGGYNNGETNTGSAKARNYAKAVNGQPSDYSPQNYR